MESKFFLNDGTIISNNDDLEAHLGALGFDMFELYTSLVDILGETDIFTGASDKADEYEMVAEHNRIIADDLRDAVELAADRLESGKSGKGYTKPDIARLLRTALDEYYANM